MPSLYYVVIVFDFFVNCLLQFIFLLLGW